MRRRKRNEEMTARLLSPGNEFGWRAHQAIQAWTSSVDVKSSIVVVIETAVAAARAKALITEKGELHSAVGLHLTTTTTSNRCRGWSSSGGNSRSSGS